MAAKKKTELGTNGATESALLRTKAEYHFEHHGEDGKITSMGLMMHYPSEAEKVRVWLDEQLQQGNLPYEQGRIRVCKRVYA